MSLINKKPLSTKNIFMQSTTLSSVRIEHKKHVRLNSLNQRTSTSIDLTLSDDVMRDQEEEEVDKSTTQSRE